MKQKGNHKEKDYFNSSDFEKDSVYWNKLVWDAGHYIVFYPVKNNSGKSRIVHTDRAFVSAFLKKRNCSLLELYGSIFALYLSRVNRSGGSLLKTLLTAEAPGEVPKRTLLKIDVKKEYSFLDLIREFHAAFREAAVHTVVDVEHYIKEKSTFYSVNDFTASKESGRASLEKDSVLTLNIYEDSLELLYHTEIFSDVYIDHLVKNLESLTVSLLHAPEQILSETDILSEEEKKLLSAFSKGKTVAVDPDN